MVENKNGLHATVVAMVVHKAAELQKKYNVELFMIYKEKKILLTSIMPLILLKVKNNEEITIESVGQNEHEALQQMCDYIEKDLNNIDIRAIDQVDSMINSNAVTWETIFNSTENGIIVTDEHNFVTMINVSASKIIGLDSSKIIGKQIKNTMPALNLDAVTEKKESQFEKLIIDKSTVIVNKTPIMVEGRCLGAVAVFQDISRLENLLGELKGVKELKEKLQLVLESVEDGICVLDNLGEITYVNNSYCEILNINKSDILGKKIQKVSPNGSRMKVLKTGEKLIGTISHKQNGVTTVANVNPIVVDGEITGVVSTVKNLSEVKMLSEKLNEMSAKAEYLEEELYRAKRPEKAFIKFKGKSGKVKDALAIAYKAAKSNATVLIRGESGTGKELIAEGIHYNSQNADGPFVRVNCAAIPPQLLESELFGHEKGAFTGAIKRKLGKFELAHNGTIFLDEIGEMEKSMQAKILRVLQDKEFQRVGGEETIKVNVRIIAATNRNLEEMLTKGEFREDLYYRLNVIPIFLPSLRERKEDITVLLEYFLKKIGEENNKTIKGITSKATNVLINYSWPGNVRELENVAERIVTLSEDENIDIKDLPLYIREEYFENNGKNKNHSVNSITEFIEEEKILPLKEYEKIIIAKALEKYGSYNAAGKALGINHKTVAVKAREFGIEE